MDFVRSVFPSSSECNEQNFLSIDGVLVSDVVREYGSPVWIYSHSDIVNAVDEFTEAFDLVCYASKAAPIIGLEQIIFSRGAGCDVASVGELEVALRAGCDPSKIVMHGNNKSDDDIAHALSSGVGRLVVEDTHECDRIERIAREFGYETVDVQLRLTPGIEAHTHEYLMTGAIDSKFGNAIEHGVAEKVCHRVIESDILQLRGFHCHIGTQIFDTEPLAQAARVVIDFYASILTKYSELAIESAVTEINVGGGFGICYTQTDDPPAPIEMARAVRQAAHEQCEKHNISDLKIWVEPGRAIVGRAGVTAYTVGSIKEIPSVRTYVAVDGGMSDNIRPSLYQAQYVAHVDGRSGEDRIVTVAGKHCEEGDLLIKDIPLPGDVAIDDVLVMGATGAYTYAMSSNYNMLPRPAVVLVGADGPGTTKLIVRRETIDHILLNMD